MTRNFLLFLLGCLFSFITSCSRSSTESNPTARGSFDSIQDERVVLAPETATQSGPVTSDTLDFVYHIPVRASSTSYFAEDLIDDVKSIKLETSPNCLLGELEQVFLYKEKVYILSRSSIYCFDFTGKFLFSISKRGKGPGEYLAIYSFCIDSDVIYLNTPRNIMCFDAHSGASVRSIPFDYFVKYMVIDGDYLYMDRSGFPNPNILADGRLLVSRLSAPDKVDVFLSDARFKIPVDQQFYGYNSSGYFMDPYYNHVYKVKNGTIVRYIFYDCGDKNLTPQEIKALVAKNFTSGGTSKATGLRQVYESSSHIISTITFDNLPFAILFDKGKRTSIGLKIDQIKRDPAKPFLSFPWGVNGVYGAYFCSSLLARGAINVQGYMNKSGVSVGETDKYYPIYKDIMNTTEEDNPILFLVKFKSVQK